MPAGNGVTDWVVEGANLPLSKLNVKCWPPLCLYFGFTVFLVSSRLLFFAFFGVFSGDLGF